MEKLIFATKNKGKMQEIRRIMAGLPYEILSMEEAGIDIEVDENGTTFEENAIIKAKAIMEASGCLTLADDSGLCIDFLGGEPGIYSARYMGEKTSYTIKNQILLDRLHGVPDVLRGAQFVCCIAAAWPDGRVETRTGICRGRIAQEPAGENGFGFDPIFYLPDRKCTTGQLDPDEKNKISHRGQALEMIKEVL